MVVKCLHGSLLRVQLEISGSSASSFCMPLITGNINFCHGVRALLHRAWVVRRCLGVPAKLEPLAFEQSDWRGPPV